ncbi:MAG: DUF1127 domain-containing protein [Alphaproteobacteria bacterium]
MHISDPLLRAYLAAAHVPDPFAAAGHTVEAPTLAIAAYRAITAIENLVRNALDALRNGHRRRVAFDELSALSDATLKDIGLPRSEIRYVVKTLNGPTAGLRTRGGHALEAVADNDNESEIAA